jgi:N-acetylglucosaminyldiphosphoundecaprenol N-acetyl-beta-D-mannosaminyltransferase
MPAPRLIENVEAKPLGAEAFATPWNDLSRNVYCVLGIPIDAINMPSVINAVEAAVDNKAPFLISTPNLNFLIASQVDPVFRESLLGSELCPADGISIVWIARLIGLPIKQRVAGSDILEAFKSKRHSARRLKLFLFGGAQGIAEVAAKVLNQSQGGLSCVGSIYPGFGTVEEMSKDQIIDSINASNADFLIAALSAKKGQLWLHRNHDRLRIPIRAHLGAAVNFAAGSVRRAPAAVQKMGLEWLWRIKEEPYLWRRYWNDGKALLGLLSTRVLPLAVRAGSERLRKPKDLVIGCTQDPDTITLSLIGDATERNIDVAIGVFRDAIATKKRVRIDLSETRVIDARFFGLFLMLRKQNKIQNAAVSFISVSSRLQTLFRLNGVRFLLTCDQACEQP